MMNLLNIKKVKMNLETSDTQDLIYKAQKGKAWLFAHQSPQNSSKNLRILCSNDFHHYPDFWKKMALKYKGIIEELSFRGMTEDNISECYNKKPVENLTIEECIYLLC